MSVKDEMFKFAAIGAVGVAIVVSALDYKSPYNQCVRAQEYINKNNKNIVWDFPEHRAHLQCAEAFGGKPD